MAIALEPRPAKVWPNVQANAGGLSGGAIYVSSGPVTMTYITFDTNTADSGGGLAVTAAAISMTDCYFIHNYAQASGTGRGGAILCEHSPPFVRLKLSSFMVSQLCSLGFQILRGEGDSCQKYTYTPRHASPGPSLTSCCMTA